VDTKSGVETVLTPEIVEKSARSLAGGDFEKKDFQIVNRGKALIGHGPSDYHKFATGVREAFPQKYEKYYPPLDKLLGKAIMSIPNPLSMLSGIGNTGILQGLKQGAKDLFGFDKWGSVAEDLKTIPGKIKEMIVDVPRTGLNIGEGILGADWLKGDGGGDGQMDLADAGRSWQGEDPFQYGGWIGRDESKMYTTDFIDSDRDGIDDRWQTAAGMPNMNPRLEEGQNRLAFPVDQVSNTGGFSNPIVDLSGYGNYAGMNVGAGAAPNLSDYYKNLGIFQNLYS
jgi:hypothetical protein